MSPTDLKNHRIVVTGGAGFLGSVVVKRLKELGCPNIGVPRSANYDLSRLDQVNRMYDEMKPDIVIHLAAKVGGIGANMERPGEFFYKNLIMGIQLMEAARLRALKKFVAVGTICAYPKHAPVPFREETVWDGYPEETNAPYGLAKKMLLVQAQAYRKQYDFNAIYLLPVNLYGPGDNFDPQSSHVIPALIRKFTEARNEGRTSVVCWGTGKASREFLYVDDAAEAIVAATERYDEGDPVNIGSGEEITIRALAEKIRELTRFPGTLEWDSSKPDGQPRRRLDVSKAKVKFGFSAKVKLNEGLQRTIKWYENSMMPTL